MAGPIADEDWLAAWLDAVRDGTASMSQRSLSAIDRHGGIETAVALARARGVHLVALTDDRGRRIVAASLHRFESLC